MAVKEKALPVPTDKQRAVLDAILGGKSVNIVDDMGKKKVVVKTAKGNPAKDAPKLDRNAVEGCMKKGWVCPAGTLTEDGKKAKRRK